MARYQSSPESSFSQRDGARPPESIARPAGCCTFINLCGWSEECKVIGQWIEAHRELRLIIGPQMERWWWSSVSGKPRSGEWGPTHPRSPSTQGWLPFRSRWPGRETSGNRKARDSLGEPRPRPARVWETRATTDACRATAPGTVGVGFFSGRFTLRGRAATQYTPWPRIHLIEPNAAEPQP